MKFIITITFLASVSNVFGQTSAEKTTPQGFNSFCSGDARNNMEKLNNKTEEIYNGIKAQRDNVNSLIAQKTIYTNLMNLKSEYLNSIKSIKDEREKNGKDIKTNIDNYRNLLRTSLTMSAVKYMLKKSSPDAKSMSDICKEEQFKGSDLCASGLWFTEKGIMRSYLNSTLENLHGNLSRVSDSSKNETISNAQKIINTIPPEIEPGKILEILKKNENLVSILTIDDQNLIKSCLSEKEDPNEKCKNLIEKKENILPLITAEMDDAEKKIVTDRLSTILSEDSKLKTTNPSRVDSTEKHKQVEQFSKINSSIENSLKSQELKDLSNASKNEVINAMGKFGLSDEEFSDYESNCHGTKNIATIDPQKCQDYNKKVYDFISTKNDELESLLKTKQTELEQAVDSSKARMATLETLKKYTTDRFNRTCQSSQAKIDQSNLPRLVGENPCNQPNSANGDKAAQSLKSRVYEVIEKLMPNLAKSYRPDSSMTFSKEEITEYNNICSNTDLKNDESVKNTCLMVAADFGKMRNVMTEIEADKYNRDYNVEVDSNPKNPYGYTAKPKKSWIRAGGEAVAASIPQFYNTMMMNMNLQYQIQELENQAMFQKQLMYMNDPNSPWMMNMPYFQNSFYSLGSGFDFQKSTVTQGFNFKN